MTLLRLHRLTRHYGETPALSAVDLQLAQGEILGLVGASGSGKSTLARIVMALDSPSSGEVHLAGRNLFALPPKALRAARADMQMVFQDPYSSLDPRRKIGTSVAEPLHLRPLPRAERNARIAQALTEVGLAPEDAEKYPHQFSGGQRQRIAIARALILRPKLLVADEPTSALDLAVQAQILDLLRHLRDSHGLAILLVTHNLAVVEALCDRVAVMQAGRIVETGPTAQVLEAPTHPYTQRLMAAELPLTP
ncbi:ABC transporter ATP-binding protein [Thioclava sp. FTW29]|uniref:ABC transporter ATP-binding protein n=1 Tax=Thioclava litoralis TaxID=3076557 RepID=A0ABZ1E6Y7_9RHOB|nr:ABC transporter ATP-binding protein [Thioclava sp. FTW29]